MPKEQVSLGLDIGNRHINMVHLAKGLSGMRLVDFASKDLDPRRGNEERLKQLEDLVREKGISGWRVNIGLSGEALIVRYITLPKMEKAEIKEALKYEAQQYIPFRIEEVLFDYYILDPGGPETSNMKVLLVAAKKEAIAEFVELIQKVGLKPNLMDVDSFSLINCFQVNGPRVSTEDVFALINLEFDLVNINILHGQLPYFTRDISLLEELLSLRFESEQKLPLFEMVKPLLTNLIREIRLSINYFESEFEKQVSAIYMSGEGAKSEELISFFNAQIGKEVRLWNPVQGLLTDAVQIDARMLKQAECMLALACGLALRNLR
jgi:type IV pilus assembly protein PilM